ncbi:MAG: methyl-accepting chemotaxis protein [Amphritea sp.]
MLCFQPGFKRKLHIVILLALIGFSVLSAISYNALQVLGVASQRVDSINHSVNLLKDLQLGVLHASAQPNAETLQQLLPQYSPQLTQLAKHSPPQQAKTLTVIHQSLENWINDRLQLLNTRQHVGLDINHGLRGEIGNKLNALDKKLNSGLLKSFRNMKQKINNFIEHRGNEQYKQVNEALEDLKKRSVKMGYEIFFGPNIADVKTAFELLSKAIFTMNMQEQNAAQAYQLLASGVESSNLFLEQQLKAAKSESLATSKQAKILVLGVGITITLLVIGLLIFTSRDVVGTLDNMSRVLNKLADGDLTQRLRVNESRGDELDKVGLAVNEMTASLSRVLTRVTHSSQSLDKGASELSQNLAVMVESNSTTNEQTASVAAAIEEISSTILDMANATNAAHQQAQQAQSSADQGGEIITSAIASLGKLAVVFDDLDRQAGELKTASGKVDGVTEMINSLAEQTNLLALNAAIEAARAGDAGRGFSVVAEEVRGLAEKTVQATQDITDIIGAMQGSIQSLLKAMTEGSDHVESGRVLGDNAATAIVQIKLLVLEVAGRNQELTVNIEEASKATQMIAENMDQVAENVSQNKEQSQEVQQYVGEVSEQATELLAMTGRFHCSQEDSTAS